VSLRPLACWDCGFEDRRGHGCLSVVNSECCQVQVSVSGLSLFQRIPTECDVSKCDREASTVGGLGPLGTVKPVVISISYIWTIIFMWLQDVG
jgi:hypothetical protein